MSARCFDNASCLQQNLYKMNGDDFPKIPQFEKQGIVSILSSDLITTPNKILSQPLHNSSNSIRRTLSADMSSPKWLHSNGFPPVKRVKSSLQLQHKNDEDDHGFTNGPPAIDDVWSSIQAEKQSWGCILSPQNNDGSGSGSDPGHSTPPYVHPLAKRSGSSLSEKSLEICTESLGSETGSDGFSYPLSEPEDSEHEEEEEEAEVYDEQVNHQVVNNNKGPTVTATVTSKRSMMFTATRPLFPPPLPSLGNRDDGSNLHIRSHRQDGRLVVEAVSVPSQNCFRAQRQDGRLLLTFRNKYGGADDDEDEDEDEEKTEKKVEAAVVEVGMKRRSTTTMMMNKFTELSNKSATWPRNYNKTVIKTLNHHHEEEEVHGGGVAAKTTVKQSLPSLPPRPITTKSTAVLNGYEYYWRRNTTTNNNTTVGMLKPLANAQTPHNHKHNTDNNNNNNKRNQINNNRRRMGGVEYGDVAPWMMLRGCKEAKKPSLLLWEPYCIATS